VVFRNMVCCLAQHSLSGHNSADPSIRSIVWRYSIACAMNVWLILADPIGVVFLGVRPGMITFAVGTTACSQSGMRRALQSPLLKVMRDALPNRVFWESCPPWARCAPARSRIGATNTSFTFLARQDSYFPRRVLPLRKPSNPVRRNRPRRRRGPRPEPLPATCNGAQLRFRDLERISFIINKFCSAQRGASGSRGWVAAGDKKNLKKSRPGPFAGATFLFRKKIKRAKKQRKSPHFS
jgi:hypothetical protein